MAESREVGSLSVPVCGGPISYYDIQAVGGDQQFVAQESVRFTFNLRDKWYYIRGLDITYTEGTGYALEFMDWSSSVR